MTMKTKILTSAATLAVAATMAGTAANAQSWDKGWGRHLPRVMAVGASINPYEARKMAVHTWRDKVASRYGFEYSRWFAARNKEVDCVKVADDDSSWDYSYKNRGLKRAEPRHYEPVTRCTVSANPARGWGYGWNNY